MAEKVENKKKLEEYENKDYYLLWSSDKRHFPYDCLGLSHEDSSVSRTNNLVNCECFQQCYISSCTLLPLRFALFLNNGSGL